MGHSPLPFNMSSFSLHSPLRRGRFCNALKPQAAGVRGKLLPKGPGTDRAFAGVRADTGLVLTVASTLDVTCSISETEKWRLGLNYLSTQGQGHTQRNQPPTREKQTPARRQRRQAPVLARRSPCVHVGPATHTALSSRTARLVRPISQMRTWRHGAAA